MDKKMNSAASATSLWRYISLLLKLVTPFRVAIGITCLVLSGMFTMSVLTTSMERFFKS